jgi:hypothetical protein
MKVVGIAMGLGNLQWKCLGKTLDIRERYAPYGSVAFPDEPPGKCELTDNGLSQCVSTCLRAYRLATEDLSRNFCAVLFSLLAQSLVACKGLLV